MAGEWQDYKVGDLFDLKPGFAFKSPDFVQSGVPVIKIKNVKAGAVVLNDLSYVNERFLETKKDYIVLHGDILITMSGNRFDGSRETWVGKVGQFLSSEPHLLNQRVAILKPKAGCRLDQRCCSYILGSPEYQDLFIAIATSSGGQANLSPGQILSADIFLPPYDEQRAISHILGTLDDKIELNRRMNETLEAMARALFRSWFVDFDPVRAKAEDRDPGLPKRLADLFPDSFEDSELGEIPKGWFVGKIMDCCMQIQNGGTPRRDESRFWDDGDIPWLTSGEVRQPIITSTENFISEAGLAGSSAKWVSQLSTVIALYGATAGQVSLISSELTTNQAVCALVPKKDFAFFNYLWMRTATSELESKAVGSAQQNISKAIVEETRVVRPPSEVLERFTILVGPIIDRWISNLHESRTLAILRDTLLPRLISGDVRLKGQHA